MATEFTKAGDLEGAKLFKRAVSVESVAKVGYKAMMKGKLPAFDNLPLRFSLRYLVPFTLRKQLLKASRKLMEKK
ncbi:MAG: hypothetical protein GY765_36790 [bacterium]|nr:hypothetical protein [bacterium]